MSGAAALPRFRNVAVAPGADGGWTIRLDDRPLRAGLDAAPLSVPTRALADAIRREWEAARDDGRFAVDALPLTGLAAAAGQVAAARADAVDRLRRFADAELLCHRASAPSSLVRREAEAWQPWLDWVAARSGIVLRPVAGVMPAPADASADAAIRRALAALDDAALAVLGVVVPSLGSLVLGLALVDGVLAPADAAALSTLDAAFEAERWGEAATVERERERLARSLAAARAYLSLGREAPAD